MEPKYMEKTKKVSWEVNNWLNKLDKLQQMPLCMHTQVTRWQVVETGKSYVQLSRASVCLFREQTFACTRGIYTCSVRPPHWSTSHQRCRSPQRVNSTTQKGQGSHYNPSTSNWLQNKTVFQSYWGFESDHRNSTFLPVNTLKPAQIAINVGIWNSVYSRLPVMTFHSQLLVIYI